MSDVKQKILKDDCSQSYSYLASQESVTWWNSSNVRISPFLPLWVKMENRIVVQNPNLQIFLRPMLHAQIQFQRSQPLSLMVQHWWTQTIPQIKNIWRVCNTWCFFSKSYSSSYDRTDVVLDVYLPSSLKSETRTKRGQGARRRVTNKGKLPPNWRNFLRYGDNKTALFKFLADKISSQDHQNLVVVTRVEQAVINHNISFEGLAPCNHEEVDTRMFVHARHAVSHGHKMVMLKANDTDVLVIAITVFPVLKDQVFEKMWLAFGHGNDTRFISVHDVISTLGLDKSKGLSFFHAFTGCDIVSAFRHKAKKTAFQTWNVFPEVSDVFAKLSKYPPVITSDDQEVIEQFVITMYDRSSSFTDIDAVRLDMFGHKQRSYDSIPPTRAALTEHTKHATYQAGCIWSQATLCHMEIDSHGEWGWKKQGNIWQIFWTSLPPVAESCKELTKCGYKTQCSGRCKCYQFGLSCTNLCSCKREDWSRNESMKRGNKVRNDIFGTNMAITSVNNDKITIPWSESTFQTSKTYGLIYDVLTLLENWTLSLQNQKIKKIWQPSWIMVAILDFLRGPRAFS